MTEPNWKNRTLFHGDNLEFLRAMNSESVDLIATDPPFNKGRDFHATPDSLAAGARFQDRWSWEQDVHEEWVDQLKDDHPRLMEAIESARHAHSDAMGAYVCFMAVRLLAMHRVLKPTGSIYLHCDTTASHYLKAVMDAIFGWQKFQNELVWQRTTGKGLNPTKYVRNCDRILYYGKSERPTWNQQYDPFDPSYGANWRKDERGPWEAENLTGGKAGGAEAYAPFRGVTPSAGRAWAPPPRSKFPCDAGLPDDYERLDALAKCEALDDAGLIHWPKKAKGIPRYKKYLSTLKGVYASDLITGVPPVSSQSKERTGYPTQKPLALYERMIRASSNEGDVVVDPFAGCATTLVAAERLNRQWVGIDIWEGAHRIVENRLREATGIFGKVSLVSELPKRTDDGGTSVPFLRVKERVKEPEGPNWTRLEMYEYLLVQMGSRCQGCDREFDDPRYLELDHNVPRADGGINHVTNRILLCGPCNRLKSNIYTLSGLRRENAKKGYMAK